MNTPDSTELETIPTIFRAIEKCLPGLSEQDKARLTTAILKATKNALMEFHWSQHGVTHYRIQVDDINEVLAELETYL